MLAIIAHATHEPPGKHVQFLEYFFTDADAAASRDMGFNAIRLGINYHHFEDDMNPRVFKYEGLKHLDRVIDIVSLREPIL